MITVLVRSADGTVLASAAHPEEVLLSVDRVYQPGDVILTGTPSGVILGRPEGERDWLQAGDVLTVREDTIGELRATMGA